MALVINTNSAATAASNHLAASSQLLQRSLNRLSSGSKIVNPADDAGGLAVSMKLSAAAKRQGAALTNLGNSTSYLQTQDGAMKVASQVLSRIGELKSLAQDPTKNASDIANYNAEFTSLQAQLTSLAGETFNGIALFGSSTLTVATTESGGGTIDVGGMDLLGSGGGGGGGGGAWTDVSGIAIGPDWNESSPGLVDTTFMPGTTYFDGNGTLSTDQTNISGPFSMSFDFFNPGGEGDHLTLTMGGATMDLTALVGDAWGQFSFQIDYDGTQTTYSINGAAAVVTADISTAGGGAVTFTHSGWDNGPTSTLENFSLTNTGGGGGGGGGSTAFNTVATAGSLTALDLSDVTDALQELATHRAINGAQQSRLGFAAEVLTTTKANLEAANSRIVDVDVAHESTQLARYNILAQAGTSMLAQANQSTQLALRLLG